MPEALARWRAVDRSPMRHLDWRPRRSERYLELHRRRDGLRALAEVPADRVNQQVSELGPPRYRRFLLPDLIARDGSAGVSEPSMV